MKTIGSILLDVELVTQEDIDQALEAQKQTGQRLGEILVSHGVVSDDDIRWALAEQLNLPYVNIRKDQIDLGVATMIPEKLARRYHMIPILKIDDELTVVVDDPLNTTILKDIEAITKSRVKVSLGRTSDIMLAIDEIYGSSEEELQKQQEAPPHFLSPWFAEDDIQKILNDPSGHALLQTILANAFAHEVSQIYFQPGFSTCREFSYWEHIMGQNAPVDEEHVRIAVSILPTAAGESAVLYVINKPVETLKEAEHEAAIPAFQQHERAEIDKIKTALQHLKSGALFLAGSPYPDKITTLYSILNELVHARKNIITLESYTEYSTDKFSQIRYSHGALETIGNNPPTISEQPEVSKSPSQQLFGLDNLSPEIQNMIMAGDITKPQLANLAYNLRSAFHIPNPTQRVLSSWLSVLKNQDADVLLVDCIGSDIVLSQCLDYAAYHLLFGAFDFKHVFELLAYCLECQVKPSVLASRLYALLAQQSVHVLCEECKQQDATDFSKQFVEQLPPASVKNHQASPEIFAPVGCPACQGTGYTHRVILFEVLKMESWLKKMLMTHVPLAEIRSTATEKGFLSLEQKSIELLLTGKTSLEQVLSIIT
jgi:type IV pilus assembly protein PilB